MILTLEQEESLIEFIREEKKKEFKDYLIYHKDGRHGVFFDFTDNGVKVKYKSNIFEIEKKNIDKIKRGKKMKQRLNPRHKRKGDGTISDSRIRICTSREDDNEIIEYVDDITDTSKKFVTALIRSKPGVKTYAVVQNPNYKGE